MSTSALLTQTTDERAMEANNRSARFGRPTAAFLWSPVSFAAERHSPDEAAAAAERTLASALRLTVSVRVPRVSDSIAPTVSNRLTDSVSKHALGKCDVARGSCSRGRTNSHLRDLDRDFVGLFSELEHRGPLKSPSAGLATLLRESAGGDRAGGQAKGPRCNMFSSRTPRTGTRAAECGRT